MLNKSETQALRSALGMGQCEHLFCQSAATTRLTVPHHKPQTLFCEKHAAEQMRWTAPYRDILGAIVVEKP